MEIVILGQKGRDDAAAEYLAGHRLHVIGEWYNPGLVNKAEASGGEFHKIGSITNVELVADYVQAIRPDMFLTNSDDALAEGVVDAIQARVAAKRMPWLLMPCPDKETARVEWDKFYLRELINEINPKYNPVNFMAENPEDVREAIDFFRSQGIEIAVKPRGLTGGKGVKVMGKHFETFAEGEAYALKVLTAGNQSGVEIQEKLEGHEFTLQIFTDGKTLIKPPATYDYPYREDGDKGFGTGGMGSFSMQAGEQLPFITQDDYDEAVKLMADLLIKMKERGHDYKGVLYPTFFKTPQGLKIVEVNARGGEGELINIMDVMEDDTDFGKVLQLIAMGELADDSVRYKKLATALLYLVAPEYPDRKGPVYEFQINPDVIRDNECRIRYASAELIAGNIYRTVGSSRVLALSALGETPWDARDKIHRAIAHGFRQPLPLDYRDEVAQEAYIRSLR